MNIKWKVLYKAYGFTPLQKKAWFLCHRGPCSAQSARCRAGALPSGPRTAHARRRRDACVPHKIKRAKGDVKKGGVYVSRNPTAAHASRMMQYMTSTSHPSPCVTCAYCHTLYSMPTPDRRARKAPYRRVCHKPYSTDRITLRSPHRLLYQSRCPQAAQLCARRRVVLLAVVLLRVV